MVPACTSARTLAGQGPYAGSLPILAVSGYRTVLGIDSAASVCCAELSAG